MNAPQQLGLAGIGARTAEGTLERVVFSKADSGWSIFRVTVDGGGLETWVGIAPPLQPGARLRATGRMENNPTYGPQLKCDSIVPMLPTTAAGIEKYLGGAALPGIGPALAKRIVAKFGADTFKVLTDSPRDLLKVQGIGPATIEKIIPAWAELRLTADVMALLEQHGASAALAARIVKRYGGKAVHVVTTQPYRLAIEVAGVGFKTADALAQGIGIAADSPERAEAATLHALGEMTQRGHCYAAEAMLVRKTVELLGPDGANVYHAIASLDSAGLIVVEAIDGEDGGSTRAVYPKGLHEAEVALAGRLQELLSAGGAELAGAAEAIAEFERSAGVTLAPEQRAAVEAAAKHKVVVVTGSPGTGKSTIAKAIMAVFDRAKVKVLLASPTGRAAKRLSETTGREASTIHRMLGRGERGGFAHRRDNPLRTGALAVDEASMMSVDLANAVLQAVPTGARVVIIGDVDQLPSVGPGAVLRDVIASGVVPTVRLTRIYRQAEGSQILDATLAINAGRAPLGIDFALGTPGEFFTAEETDADQAAALVVSIAAISMRQRFGYDPVRDVQIITPMVKGTTGTVELNRLLQDALNPYGQGLQRGVTMYRVGDKVIQTKNDYDRGVFNGDIGYVSDVDLDAGRLLVDIDGREVPYEKGDLENLMLAYAISCHRFQGSEAKAVVVVLLREHYMLLSRNWLYTAVSRGKKHVVLVYDPSALSVALRETRRELRCTRLAARIRTCGM